MALPIGVTLRRADPVDAERVAHLQLDCWDDAYTGLVPQAVLDGSRDRPAYLWVVEGNTRAMGFYERQGFRLDGATKREPEGLHLRMART